MASPPLITYQDVIDHLTRFTRDGGQGALNLAYYDAIQFAYRDIVFGRQWKYYWKPWQISLEAQYTTGTIAYDHCVTPEHEALTRNGWSKYTDLKVGDEILAYDHTTCRTSWQRIQHLHVSYFNGDIREVSRRGGVVLRCTPNHKFPSFKRVRSDDTLTQNGFIKSKDLNDECFVPLAAECEWPEESALTAKQAAILGWAITDGYGLLDKDRDYGAGIVQSITANPVNCAAIAELTGTKQRGPYKSGTSSFCIPAKIAREIRKVIKRTIDLPHLVTRLSREAAEAMHSAMLAAEGSCTRAGRFCFTQWREKRKPIAEAFQMLSLLLGRPANFREQPYDDSIRYQITVRTSRHFKPNRGSKHKPYSGMVWCPQVESGAWVCRCNGYVTITGNSGGSSERMLTLTAGTWPSWAAYGRIIIDSHVYEVESRVSSSVITLTENSNPGADIASGTSYTLYRSTYTLPSDFKGVGQMTMETSRNSLAYIPIERWKWAETWVQGQTGTPTFWTIGGDPDLYGSYALFVNPTISTADPVKFIYQREPRPIKYTGYGTNERTGTLSVSAGTTAVTGSSTAFQSTHVGSVLRVGTATASGQEPTGLSGLYPYSEQKIVSAVGSTTSLTLDSAMTAGYSGVRYTISDPIDMSPGMINAMLRAAEWQLAIVNRMTGLETYAALYKDARRRAAEADTDLSFAESSAWGNTVPSTFLRSPTGANQP